MKKIPQNNIAELRKKRGYTQLEFADKVGIWNDYLSRIETGKKSCSLDLLNRIADALEVPLSDIFLK